MLNIYSAEDGWPHKEGFGQKSVLPKVIFPWTFHTNLRQKPIHVTKLTLPKRLTLLCFYSVLLCVCHRLHSLGGKKTQHERPDRRQPVFLLLPSRRGICRRLPLLLERETRRLSSEAELPPPLDPKPCPQGPLSPSIKHCQEQERRHQHPKDLCHRISPQPPRTPVPEERQPQRCLLQSWR